MATGLIDTLLPQLRDVLAAQRNSKLPDRQLLEAFVLRGEEAAFAVLVERHGPMVLRVCQRVLHNHHAAEDIFQATFLVLARKAGSITKRESLSCWLHGVAYRLSLKARSSAARQSARERRIEVRSAGDPLDDVTGRELLSVLDEELSRLPEKYRVPLVLCYLEGQTRDEAAQQLGCPLGTFKHRLVQARETLRDRLGRRGLALSAVLGAALLATGTASAAVPAALTKATVANALSYGLKQATTGSVVAKAAGLADLLLRPVLTGFGNITLAFFVALAVVVAAVVLLLNHAEAQLPLTVPAETPEEEAPVYRLPIPETPPLPYQLEDESLPGPLVQGSPVRLRTKFQVYSLAFAPDSKTLAAGSDDKMVRLWDVTTGKDYREFAVQLEVVYALAIAPDGKTLAAGGNDHTVRLLTATTGQELARLGPHEGRIQTVAFSTNSKTVATGGVDHAVYFWEATTGRELRRVAVDDGAVLNLTYLADDKALAMANGNLTLQLWDTVTTRLQYQLPLPSADAYSAAFSPDGTAVAVGCDDSVIRLWEVRTGKELRKLPGHKGRVSSVAFSPDGRMLASGGADQSLLLWNVADLRQTPAPAKPRSPE